MHEQFGIGTINQGGQLSHSGRGQVEAGAGDVITVNPGEVHDGAPVGDVGRSWRILYFEPTIISQASVDLHEGGSEVAEIQHPVLRDRRAYDLARRLFVACTRPGPAMLQEEMLLATLAAIGAQRRQPKAAMPSEAIARARELIDDDPAVAVTLGDLAEVSGLGRFQLLRGFARATGLTPHAYIIQRRIEAARRLIMTGTALADAAAASGFADQSHMTRAFTSRFGLTPKAYAQAVR